MTHAKGSDTIDLLLTAIKTTYEGNYDLAGFAPWPTETMAQPKTPVAIPATKLVRTFDLQGTIETQPVVDAIRAVSDDVHWTQTYSEAEVGRDFLNRYGYFEVLGPTGHFHSDSLRCFVAYWGARLDYGWHNHAAEELYFSLAGEGLFHANGEDDVTLKAGATKYHHSLQNHAMKTHDAPYLCLVFWRGDGITQLPKMTP